MKQFQEIKQNWIGIENFDICFCVIFDYKYESFIFRENWENWVPESTFTIV